MHGLGNDFMVIERLTQTVDFDEDLIKQWSDRHTGVGFDQLLVVDPPNSPDIDFIYRIYNADGSEVEQCGNGARCFARFVREKQFSPLKTIRVATNTGVIELKVQEDEQVTVDMGVPNFSPASLPFSTSDQQSLYHLQVGSNNVEFGAVSMGNPHITLNVDDIKQAPVETLGPLLEQHEQFPNRVNVGFMQVISRKHIKLRVFERGVGETQACGTGACAAVAIGQQQGLLDDNVKVDLPGGTLTIEWHGDNTSLMMTGPTAHVFDGAISVG